MGIVKLEKQWYNYIMKTEEIIKKLDEAITEVKNKIASKYNRPYKYEISAAVINKNGAILEEEIFDEDVKHGELFKQFAYIFEEIVESPGTFEAGVECAEKGLVAEHVVWETISFYLPDNITNEQLIKLIIEIVNRPNYTFEVYRNGEILENMYHSYDVLEYLKNYLEETLESNLSSKAV